MQGFSMFVRLTTICLGLDVAQTYSVDQQTDLRNLLFDNYQAMQRPQQRVSVTTSLNLLALNSLDIKEQKLSVTAYFYFVWFDYRLRWQNNNTYGNSKFMFSNEKTVWKPAIIVENSVDDIDVLSRPNVPMRILKNGNIAWMPAGIFTTHCESTITYWPLDTQTCDITLTSWAYTDFEVRLELDQPPFVMKFYQENGEWELMDHVATSSIILREIEIFSRLTFTLKFRRRPMYHILNTLFPVVLMGFLTVAIFKLSPESGERVGLALTVLLAYAVYLSLISENIPQTSISTSLLSTYLASIMFLQTLSVLLTVIYIDIYLKPPETPVPAWLQSVTASFLSRLACVDGCCNSNASVANSSKDEDSVRSISTIEDFEVEEKGAWEGTNERVYESSEDESVKQYTWKEIALMLDKITMYIYLFLVVLFTGASMTAMLVHYHTSYSVV